MLLPFFFLFSTSLTDNRKHLWEEVTEGVVDCQLAIGIWTHLVFMSNILRNPEQETTILQFIPYVQSPIHETKHIKYFTPYMTLT